MKVPSSPPGEGERTQVAEIDPSMFDEDIPTEATKVPNLDAAPRSEERSDTPKPAPRKLTLPMPGDALKAKRSTIPPPEAKTDVEDKPAPPPPRQPTRPPPDRAPDRPEPSNRSIRAPAIERNTSKAQAETPPPARTTQPPRSVSLPNGTRASPAGRAQTPPDATQSRPDIARPEPTPRSTQRPTSIPPQAAAAAPARTTQPPRSTIPPRAAEPAKSSISKYGLAAIGVLGVLIAGGFMWAATRVPKTVDGSGLAADLPSPEIEGVRNVEGTYVAASGTERSPLELDRTRATATRMDGRTADRRETTTLMPTPKRIPRHAMMYGFREPGAPQHYGFEIPERPKKREYETEAPPNMLPMLIVFTEPPGVAIDVDGTLMGMTPFMRVVPGDKARVDVRLWGGAYKEQRHSISKDAEGNFKLGVTMELKPKDTPPIARGQEQRPPGSASFGPQPPDPDREETKKEEN